MMYRMQFDVYVDVPQDGSAGLMALQIAKGLHDLEGVEIAGFSKYPDHEYTITNTGPRLTASGPISSPAAGANEPEEPEKSEDETPSDEENPVVLPADIPYLQTLRSAGVDKDEVVERARAGTLTEIKGVGPAGAKSITEYLLAQSLVEGDGSDEEEPEGSDLDALLGGDSDEDDEPEYTISDVRRELGALGQAKGHGIQSLKKVLSELGVSKVSDIPEEKYGTAVRRARELRDQ